MSYRKITVNGVEHQYTVGKTHVKVRGMQAVPKEDVGHVEEFDPICDCCGEPASVLYPDDPLSTRFVVTPKDIERFITEHAG